MPGLPPGRPGIAYRRRVFPPLFKRNSNCRKHHVLYPWCAMPKRMMQAAALAVVLLAGRAGFVRADEPPAGQAKPAELSAAETLNQQELEALQARASQMAPADFMGAPLMLQSIEDISRLR